MKLLLIQKINSLLRNYHKFNGLILTDDIAMKGLQDNLEQIVKNSFNAGCDVILHCNGKNKGNEKNISISITDKKNITKTFLMIYLNLNGKILA